MASAVLHAAAAAAYREAAGPESDADGPPLMIHVNGGPAAWHAMVRDLTTPAVPLTGACVLMREPDEEG